MSRENPGAGIFVCRLARPYFFASPIAGQEYAAWILSNDSNQTSPEVASIARALVASGCRYAVCSGYQCSQWDDAVDFAFLFSSPDLNPPDEMFVMTSWHEKESIEEVAVFFVRHTAFDNFLPVNFVLVSIGNDPIVDIAENAVRRLLSGSY